MPETRRPRPLVALVIVAVAVLVGVLVVGFLPSPVDGGVEPLVRRILAWLQGLGAPVWVDYDFAQAVANVLFFVPVGFLGAVLLPRRVWWLAIPIGGVLSFAIEFGQLLFLPHRFASWGDVAANTIGAVLGAVIGFATRLAAARRREGSRRSASRPPARRSEPR